MTPDTLHSRLRSVIEERLKVARRFSGISWRLEGGSVIFASDGTHAERCAEAYWEGVGEFIALHDPSDAIRRYERDLRVLDRHAPRPWAAGAPLGPADCSVCVGGSSDYDTYPCADVLLLAESLGIEP